MKGNLVNQVKDMTPTELRDYANTLEQSARYDEITDSFEGQLALLIHAKTCKFNHTDGCSFFYETYNNRHNWDNNEHKVARRNARDIMLRNGFQEYLLKNEN